MTNEELQAQIAELQAQNDALKAEKAKRQTVSCKVGNKGGVSVYGLGRFPVTLYASQWERLMAASDNIKAFIEEHRSELKVKE
jgi:hypothetical protein